MKLRRLKKLQAFKSAHYLREVHRGYVKRLSTAEETRARIQENYPGPWVSRLYCFNQKSTPGALKKTELQQNRIKLAAVYLKDAMAQVLSPGSRSSAAFDAGYLYTLVALDMPANGKHPSLSIVRKVAQHFGLTGQEIHSAILFFEQQYAPTGPGNLLTGLLAWALQMKLLAEHSQS